MRSKDKTKTLKEEFIERTVNLTLTGVEAKEMWATSKKAANDNIFTVINIKIARFLNDTKSIIDNIIGKENKDKVQSFFADLFLIGK